MRRKRLPLLKWLRFKNVLSGNALGPEFFAIGGRMNTNIPLRKCVSCGATLGQHDQVCLACKQFQPLHLRAGSKCCIACGTALSLDAYVCTQCKEYQTRWRNELKYWAGLASLLALIGSAAIFSFSILKTGKDFLWPATPQISDLNTFSRLTIVNMSGQGLWVKHLSIFSEQLGADLRWDIERVLDPSKMESVDLVQLAKYQFANTDLIQKLFGRAAGNYATFKKDDPVLKGENFPKNRWNEYTPAFLLLEGPEDKQVKRFLRGNKSSKDVFEMRCSAKLSVVFTQSQISRELSIPCVSYLKHVAREQQGHE